MLKALERILKSRIEMYETFIVSRKTLNMDTTENMYRKQECESLLIIIQEAIKKTK